MAEPDTDAALLEHRSGVRACELLDELLAVVLAKPTPSGRERELAEALVAWGADHPVARWHLHPLDADRANLTVEVGDGLPLGFYAHLDTTLSGDPALDLPLTGVGTPPSPPDLGAVVVGHGLAVAKGPAACAVAALVATAEVAAEAGVACPPGVVLLTAGGTHRSPSGGFDLRLPAGIDRGLGLGVEAALAAGFTASAMVNVKGGAAGLMYEEPGCLLVRIRVRDTLVAMPGRATPPGAAVRAAAAALAVERWRDDYRRHIPAVTEDGPGQIAPEAGVGAIEAGLPYKPDLLPGAATVYAYVVLVHDADVDAILASLHERVVAGVAEVDQTATADDVTVEPYGYHPAARTPPDHPVVAVASRVLDELCDGDAPVVTGYRGSTDGVILRRHGLPTVRLGPTARARADDPTTDAIPRAELDRFATAYVRILHRYHRAADGVADRMAARVADAATAGTEDVT